MTTDFRVFYIHPEGNRTGSFGVHPGDIQALEAWRTQQGHTTLWEYVRHPDTGERLHAFRPVEEGTAEMERVREKGIHHGQLCRVTYRAIRRGGRVMMKFVDIEPLA